MKDSSKKSKIRTVMHEFKTGKLKSSSGDKVTNPKQAIAIALSEANMAKNKKRGGGVIMASKKSTMGEALRGGGAIMASKRSTMGEALAKGGQVKGTGAAIKGIRPAKMY